MRSCSIASWLGSRDPDAGSEAGAEFVARGAGALCAVEGIAGSDV
jgi:hypothetical protein